MDKENDDILRLYLNIEVMNILIATQNNDKFKIAKELLSRCGLSGCSFRGLKDADIASQAEEYGDLMNRALIKARHAYDMSGENGRFDVYVGIDDGMKYKNGAVDENSKEVAEKILCQGFLDVGETITNVRAFVFLDGNGEVLEKFEVEIPLKFIGNQKGIRLADAGYPLSRVLAPSNGDRSISEMSEEDAFQYYLLFLERNMKEVAAKIAKIAGDQL